LPEVSALFVTILGLGIAAAAFPEAHRVLF